MVTTSTLKTKNSLQANIGLMLILQVVAIFLCFGGPLIIFAPVPLILSLLVFGRVPALAATAVFAGLIWGLSMKFPSESVLFLNGIHLGAVLSAIVVAEVIFKNRNPVKGLIISGLIFVTLIGGTLILSERSGRFNIKNEIGLVVDQVFKTIKENNKEVIEQNNEEARAVRTFLADQKKVVEDIMNFMPSIVFVTAFFSLWVSLYSVLRLSKVWRNKILYSFGTRDLITFKTPEYFVYPLIASLVMVVGSGYGLGPQYEIIGLNLLYCLGIFYLFQGFGVLYDFLTFARIGGIFKSAIMAFVLMTSFKFLAIIGMFDLWFDFRKYFTKKNNDEGDML